MKRYLLSILIISTLLISTSAQDPCVSTIYFDISKSSDRIDLFDPDDGYEYNLVLIVNVTSLDNVKLELDHFRSDYGIIEEIHDVGIYNFNFSSYRVGLEFVDISDETGNSTLVAEGNVEFTECGTIASTHLISFPIPSLMTFIGCMVIYNKYRKSYR
jgi:hypothetical protein